MGITSLKKPQQKYQLLMSRNKISVQGHGEYTLDVVNLVNTKTMSVEPLMP
jgi:hypothetical protein